MSTKRVGHKTKRVGGRRPDIVTDAEVEHDQKNHKSWRERAGKRLVFGSWPEMPWRRGNNEAK